MNYFKMLVACLVFVMGVAHAGSVQKVAAPDFTLPSLSGSNIRLGELKGDVVLLNFWASWCAPCRLEMPLLNKLHNKYKAIGFTVLGVNVEESNANAVDFLKENKVDFPILWDNENTVSKRYNVLAMPTTVMIDRDGQIRYIHKGYKEGDGKVYKKVIKQLIRE